ncbi:MAG: hypothetical protein LBD03_07170 [Methanobrevibacter sp.]|jgi:ribosomal protein S6|nr:hypothetical protein [Candidatus Methanovirga procula]
MNDKYKVLTKESKTKLLGVNDLDHKEIEKELNEYSEQGYKLINFEVYQMELSLIKFIAILEKE